MAPGCRPGRATAPSGRRCCSIASAASSTIRAARRARPGPRPSRLALAPEDAAGLVGGQAGLDRADLALRLGVVGLELEDFLEVAQRLAVAAEHALDAAEVEPGALGALRAEHGALERLAGIGA